MGLSGLFLKRKEDLEFEKIWDMVQKILNKTGYVYDYHKKSEQVTVYEYRYSDKYLMMYLPREEELKWNEGAWFEWMGKGDSLFRAILIENISGRGEMLLRFVEEYLKINPHDIFYDDLDWYYTKDDIDKIIEKKVDPETWYCINPAEI